MKSKAIGWAVVLSLILLGTQAVLAGPDKQPLWIEAYGGFDESWNYWPLTDESLVALENGDSVMVIWAGPDGAIDPPVRAVGSPFNGQPTGDDMKLFISPPGGIIEDWTFYFTVTTWNIGNTDSLGRQRHPTIGDLIYARVFNGSDLVNANYYGDSELHEVIYEFQELWFSELPNDPYGPTTDQGIFGKYFKVIGGIDPGTGQTFKLKDPSADLEDGDLVQLIWVGSDGEIDAPDLVSRMPSDDDTLIEQWGVNEGRYPSTGTGTFKRSTAAYDDQSHGLPAKGDDIYVRLINSDNILAATHYGDSPIYEISYEIGESLSVFYDDAVDCDTEFPPTTVRNFTIHGGWDPVFDAYYPLVDAFGVRLKDGDRLHLIWVGPDGEPDEMDAATGMPTDDDSLWADLSIGDGIAGTGTGRFKYEDFTEESGTREIYLNKDDVIYLRVFDDPTIGDDSGSQLYGESETYTVQWEYNEAFYSFADSTFDAVTVAPWYRTIMIYGGQDTAMTEYPLTNYEGEMLMDGDLVQIIWAGPDGLISIMDTTGNPTGDDSLLVATAIGVGVGSDTGLFRAELQTFATSTGGFPAKDDVIYVRVFEDPEIKHSPYFGESVLHQVAYEQGELFFCFDDEENDCNQVNPAYTIVQEWTTPTASLPAEYALLQNYPNPFNPDTDIQYQIPQAGWVKLTIYNVLGQEISTLVDGPREAGNYTVRWFGTDGQGRELGSGIYFYRLSAGDFTAVRKMVLMK
jgi:hypothetical protein